MKNYFSRLAKQTGGGIAAAGGPGASGKKLALEHSARKAAPSSTSAPSRPQESQSRAPEVEQAVQPDWPAEWTNGMASNVARPLPPFSPTASPVAAWDEDQPAFTALDHTTAAAPAQYRPVEFIVQGSTSRTSTSAGQAGSNYGHSTVKADRTQAGPSAQPLLGEARQSEAALKPEETGSELSSAVHGPLPWHMLFQQVRDWVSENEDEIKHPLEFSNSVSAEITTKDDSERFSRPAGPEQATFSATQPAAESVEEFHITIGAINLTVEESHVAGKAQSAPAPRTVPSSAADRSADRLDRYYLRSI